MSVRFKSLYGLPDTAYLLVSQCLMPPSVIAIAGETNATSDEIDGQARDEGATEPRGIHKRQRQRQRHLAHWQSVVHKY